MLGVCLDSVDNSNAKYERVGTCEYCFSSAYCDNPVWTLLFPDGTLHSFDAFYWDCGDYYQLRIDNYIRFSEWLFEFDFDIEQFSEDNYKYMKRVVDCYKGWC